jgi:hypothetical protein
MPEPQLFEYAIIRIVPRVEREEFMNVGVALYCARLKYLRAKFFVSRERLTAFSGMADVSEIEAYLQAFGNICAGNKDAGPIGRLPLPERFRWLTATRSTVLQTSKVHPGLSDDMDAMLERIFCEMVAPL